jgi:HAE1 family hydrophobic/amphiphilic exporter-1
MAQVDPLLLQKPTSSFLRGGITFAITRPVAILMLTLAVVVFGYVSYFRLPLNLMPDISYPSITVRTEYAGAPSDVEELISKPVEQALGVINNLVHISSISRADVSDVLLEFAWGTDMDEVYQSIREKLGTLFLPKEAQKPLLLRYDPSLDPILRIALYGGKSEFERRWITEQEIKRKIESLPGVAAIKIKGGLEKEIIVDIDHHLLEKYKMDIGQILKRLREENINMASGRIQEAETEYLVRSINQFKSVEEIQNLVIAKREEQKIHIRDLATVSWSHKEREVITRINGKDSVEISIYKEGDANLVQVAERVKRALFGTIHPPSSPKKDLPPTTSQESPTSVSSATEEKTKESESTISTEEEKQGVVQHKETLIPLSQQLPAGMKLEILSDQSIFIKNAINEVRDTALMGAFLAIVILLFFLKKFSVTLIIGISIPISIIATFAPMYIYKVSLNIMSLGGLALGAGMLVDNSIVVLEAIFRRRERGENFFDSALYGTEEVAGAVIASTLTTVCVFFPIVFVEGIAGQVFKDQALSVVFSLLASLVVAIFLIPMLTTRQLSAQQVQGFQWFSFHSGKELKQWWKNWSWLRWCLLFLLIFPRFLLFLGVELLGKLLLLVLVLLVLGIKYFSKLVLLLLKPFLFPLFFIGDSSLNLIHRFYTVTLRWILHHQLSIVLPILGLFLYSLYVSQFLGRELIPKVNQGEFTVELFLPVGTPLQKTNRVLEPLENQAIAYEEIELLSSTIGVQKEAILSSDEGEHTAKLLVRLRPQDLKKEESFTESLYKTFRSEPEIQEIKVSYPSLFSIKTPIEIEIRGYNLQILKQLAEEVVTIFSGNSGLL